MAERYPDRPFSAGAYDRGDQQAAPKSESDPLAELARLIGQTDPFSNFGRGNAQVQPHAAAQHRQPADMADDEPSELGPPPSWMQNRGAAAAAPMSARHPLRPATVSEPESAYSGHDVYDNSYAAEGAPLQADHGRYDDALYGQIEPAHGGAAVDPYAEYPEQPYGYQDGYAEEAPEAAKPRRSGMTTVIAVVALAVVGTGAAFGYRSYMGSPRTGEAPVIRADAGPTKIVPPSAENAKPIQDRLAGTEALVSREEQPVDASKAGPRVVLPPSGQAANSPFPPVGQVKAASPTAAATPPSTGALTADEPRKIRTLSVRPDQADLAANPAPRPTPTPRNAAPAAPAATAPRPPVANANASSAPLSLAPQAAEPRTRVASAPSEPAASGGGYVVQVSSQRSAADAQASYRTLQGKFPGVLGSRAPLIKRADLGDKGVYYRAMVGPFGSPEEASSFCGNLKTAGGQCVVQRN